jgi:hypothetical protein
MHLMKWFRKNNQKIMAVVVVVLMVGFVGGTALTRSCENLGQNINKSVAVFGNGQKITSFDVQNAQSELAILLELKADSLLRSLSIPMMQTNSLQGITLGEVLFSERQSSPMTVSYLKQAKVQGFTISDKQIYDIYKRTEPAYVYWFLLKKEAGQAGVRISKEQAKIFLTNFIPQFFQGATYAQVINAVVNAPLRTEGFVSEDQVLSSFSDLMSVLEYCKAVCSTENVTEQQVKYNILNEMQTVDVNYVRFDSGAFIKDIPEPNVGLLNEQFTKFKDDFIGQVSQQNPYGFGYKISDCAQLQYIAVRLDDVEKIVPKPTQEEIEQFFTKNKAYFTSKVPSDPNDPNSTQIEQTKSFPEVADSIERTLLQKKIDTKSGQIIQRASVLTENPETASNQISAEQFLKIESNYSAAAKQLKTEFGIDILVGRTGLLSASDIQHDPVLGRLILEGPQFDPVRNPTFEWLFKIVFAVDQLGTSDIDSFTTTKPQMYKNIGLLNDVSGKIKAIVRIVDAQKAHAPENMNQSFNKESIAIDPCSREIRIYSVKESVAKDLKKLAAIGLTKQKADEFKQQVERTGNWQQAIDKLNAEYPKTADKEITGPNNFQVVSQFSQQQISDSRIESLKLYAAGNPALDSELRTILKQRMFIEQLHALADDANTPKTPFIWRFEPDLSFYCIKDLSIRHVNQNDYDSEKVRQMFLEDTIRSQSLALVYFNPDNILKRTQFKWLKPQRAADANQPNL